MFVTPTQFFNNLTFDLIAQKCALYNLDTDFYSCPHCKTPIVIRKTYTGTDWGECPNCNFNGYSVDFYAAHRNLLIPDSINVLRLLGYPEINITHKHLKQAIRMFQLYTKQRELLKGIKSNFQNPLCMKALRKLNLRISVRAESINYFIGTLKRHELYLLKIRGAVGKYININKKKSTEHAMCTLNGSENDVIIVPLYESNNRRIGYLSIDCYPHLGSIIMQVFDNLNKLDSKVNAGFILPINRKSIDVNTPIILFNNPIYAIRCNLMSWIVTQHISSCLPFAGYFNTPEYTTYDWNVFDGRKKIFVVDPMDNISIKTAINQDGYIYTNTELDKFTQQIPHDVYTTVVDNNTHWLDFVKLKYESIGGKKKKELFLWELGIYPTDNRYKLITGTEPDLTGFINPEAKHKVRLENHSLILNYDSKRRTPFGMYFNIQYPVRFFSNNPNVDSITTCKLLANDWFNIPAIENTTIEHLRTHIKQDILKLLNKRDVPRNVMCDSIRVNDEELFEIHNNLYPLRIKEFNDKLGWDGSKFRFSDFSIKDCRFTKEESVLLPDESLLSHIDKSCTRLSMEDKKVLKAAKETPEIICILQHLLAFTLRIRSDKYKMKVLVFKLKLHELATAITKAIGMCQDNGKDMYEFRKVFNLRLYGEVNYPLFINKEVLGNKLLHKQYDVQNFGLIFCNSTLRATINSMFSPLIYVSSSVIKHKTENIKQEVITAAQHLFFSCLRTLSDLVISDRQHYDRLIQNCGKCLVYSLGFPVATDFKYELYNDTYVNKLRFLQLNKEVILSKAIHNLELKEYYMIPAIEIDRLASSREVLSNELRIPDILVESGIGHYVTETIENERVVCLALDKKYLDVEV